MTFWNQVAYDTSQAQLSRPNPVTIQVTLSGTQVIQFGWKSTSVPSMPDADSDLVTPLPESFPTPLLCGVTQTAALFHQHLLEKPPQLPQAHQSHHPPS